MLFGKIFWVKWVVDDAVYKLSVISSHSNTPGMQLQLYPTRGQ